MLQKYDYLRFLKCTVTEPTLLLFFCNSLFPLSGITTSRKSLASIKELEIIFSTTLRK